MRRKLIAGNWKMNGLQAEGLTLAEGLSARLSHHTPARDPGVDVAIFPPATLIAPIVGAVSRSGSKLTIGGQDCHTALKGAYTGDVSAAMLKDSGAKAVILGHSERRTHHHETDAQIQAKITIALSVGLMPVVCIGETAAQYEQGQTVQVLQRQLDGTLPPKLDPLLVLAYEPVWAIGTGKTPTPQNIAHIHGMLRTYIAQKWGKAEARSLRILYGGSVTPDNAREILALADIDGALVGGASLDLEKFWGIITSCP